ncbi:hypothetical protein HYY75_06715 [bacterium]|nr:hypothetical protein [bacterium]
MRRTLSSNLIRPVFLLTLTFEIITVFFRFGLGLESSRDTASILGKLTLGVRIHHGYIGFLILFFSAVFSLPPIWKRRFIILGWALFISDLVHHFLVLWVTTGSPQLDLLYPKN